GDGVGAPRHAGPGRARARVAAARGRPARPVDAARRHGVGGATRGGAGPRPQRAARRGRAAACRCLAPRPVRPGHRGDHAGGVPRGERRRGTGTPTPARACRAGGGGRRPVSVVDALQLVLLVAFAVINGTQLGGLVLASRALLMRDRRASRLEEVALARAATYLPVSFLVPAYNEEATIVGSVRSLLA